MQFRNCKEVTYSLNICISHRDVAHKGCGTLLKGHLDLRHTKWCEVWDNWTLWIFVFCTFQCWCNWMLWNVQHVQEE